jgi:tRNA threonylcarbamoyl adenosine modification protein YeaZ
MPHAIAIETSGRIGSVAAVEEGQLLEELAFPHGLHHAAQIVPLIDRLCVARGWTPTDVRQLYVSIGPGSFTGLRIAVTLAKTLALATGAKLVAVPTARVLVENAPPEARQVIVALDAKRGQVLAARYERPADPQGGEWLEREPAHLDTLSQMLARSARPVHLLGEGLEHHRQFIPADDPGIVQTQPHVWRAQARVVGRIGHAMARRGAFADPVTLTPLYIRLPEAEEKRRIVRSE